MKKIVFVYLSVIIGLTFSSCKNKSTENNSSNKNIQIEKDTSLINHSIQNTHNTQPEIVLRKPFPEEIHGIWGNIKYLNDLRKYNSIGKVLEYMKFDTEIKINKDLALIMRPQYMEPTTLDTIKYILLKSSQDSLYVRSRNTGEKQLYIKLMTLPDTILWNLYGDDKYSAIAQLEWKWFNGKYTLVNDFGGKSDVTFFDDGSVSGMWQYRFYSFGIDVDGKDFIYMRSHDEEYIYFLIENQPNGEFICYNVEDIDDWEYPFVKKSLAFTLKKTNDK